MRYAALGAAAYAAVIPLMEVVFSWYFRGLTGLLWMAGLTLCYLPGYLLLVHRVASGARMRHTGWVLVSVVVAAAASGPLSGHPAAGVSVGVAALLVLRAPWSLVVVGAWIIGAGVGHALWLGVSLVWQIASVYSLVALVGVMRRLRVVRAALAEEAVERERAHAEQQLNQTIGAALEAIAGRGDQVATRLRDPREDTSEAIEAVASESRAALSDARRIIGELSRRSVRSELETARSLLAAAGVQSTVTASGADVETDDQRVRTALRVTVSELLEDPGRRGSVSIAEHDDGLRFISPRQTGETR